MAFCNCDFKNTFPGISLKYSFYGLPLPSLPRKITYIMTVLRQKRSQIWLFRFPHASSDSCLLQYRSTWPATILRYGLQHTGCHQINSNNDGVQNFGGLLSLRYLCSSYGNITLSYLKKSNFNVEGFRIICPSTMYIHFLRI